MLFGDDLANGLISASSKCRRCGGSFTFEEGANCKTKHGITDNVLMCPACKSVYEVSISPRGMALGANVSSKYDSLLHPASSENAQSVAKASSQATMRWYHYMAYFFGGAFLANALPHFGNGISGHPFQSPFASPPGEGLSSSTVNILWGLFNLAVGYLLLCRVGKFDLRRTRHVLILGAGIVIMSVMLAHAFGRFHGGL